MYLQIPQNSLISNTQGEDVKVKSDEIKIVLADNRASNRRGLRALLAFEPRIVIVGEASNGIEATGLVESEQPDLVLMDVHMPVMDGLKATQKIKSTSPAVKVVLYSIYPDYKVKAQQAGADYFLVKGSLEATPSDIILSFFPREDPTPG